MKSQQLGTGNNPPKHPSTDFAQKSPAKFVLLPLFLVLFLSIGFSEPLLVHEECSDQLYQDQGQSFFQYEYVFEGIDTGFWEILKQDISFEAVTTWQGIHPDPENPKYFCQYKPSEKRITVKIFQKSAWGKIESAKQNTSSVAKVIMEALYKRWGQWLKVKLESETRQNAKPMKGKSR